MRELTIQEEVLRAEFLRDLRQFDAAFDRLQRALRWCAEVYRGPLTARPSANTIGDSKHIYEPPPTCDRCGALECRCFRCPDCGEWECRCGY